MAIELTLLGTTDLRRDDGSEVNALLTQPRCVALLAYLGAAGPRPGAFHRRDTLVGLFWAEAKQEQARANLRKLVHTLRKELGEEAIEARGDEELRLAQDLVWCDVVEFESAIARGRLARADELYRGELLPGFYVPGAPVPEFDQWLAARRQQLAEQAADVAWKLASRLDGENNPTDAAKWAIRAARLSLHDERRFLHVARLLDRHGLGGRAIALYEDLVRRLAELGLKPSREVRELIDEIRRKRTQ
jgi:DNA-binding SARP family transcriptional activator